MKIVSWQLSRNADLSVIPGNMSEIHLHACLSSNPQGKVCKIIRFRWKSVPYLVCLNCPLEVGSRGVIFDRNSGVLAMIASMCRIRDVKNLKRTVGKIALLGSYRIWISRKSQTWVGGNLIQPWVIYILKMSIKYLLVLYMNPCERR